MFKEGLLDQYDPQMQMCYEGCGPNLCEWMYLFLLIFV